MNIIRCAPLGTTRWIRRAVVAVLLLSGGGIWLSSVLPLRPPVSYSLGGVSELSSRQVDVRSRPALRPADSRLAGALSDAPGPLQEHQRLLLVLHWTEGRKAKEFRLSLHNDSFSGCPINNCRGTGDRSLLSKADAVLFHGRVMKLEDLPLRRLLRQRFVFVLRESPRHTKLPLKKLDGFFNLTMTYSRDADVSYPYGQTAEGKQNGTLPFFHRRRRLAAWVVSYCTAHSQRKQYISQLQQYIPVDILGGCGTERCPGPLLYCYRRLAETHLFYLAFENSLCDDYITEKFWLALEVGLVPVVRGPPPEHYRRVAPPHSFIHVEEFAGPKALADHLLSLAQNRSGYLRYQAWRRSHHVQQQPALCDLCRRLNRAGQDQVVRLSEEWDVKTHCHEPRDLHGDS